MRFSTIAPKAVLLAALASVTIFSSCKKSDDSPSPSTPANTTNSVSFYFQPTIGSSEDAVVYDQSLTDTLGRQGLVYTNANGDSLSFGTVRYWISNVKLGKADGTWWSEDSSYHLVEQGTGLTTKQTFQLKRVPSADYTKIQFSVGVDSLPNFNSSVLKGDLNTGIGMSWNWNTGYIFLKIEGQFKKSNGSLARYYYHVGNPPRPSAPVLWSDPTSNYKTITLDLPNAAKVSGTVAPNIHLHANILAPFGIGGGTLPVGGAIQNLKVNSIVMGGPISNSIEVMNNVKGAMFRVDHVHND
jgi:hypothetical protein